MLIYCILGIWICILDVWACVWVSGLVFGCLDLYLGVWTCIFDVWTCFCLFLDLFLLSVYLWDVTMACALGDPGPGTWARGPGDPGPGSDGRLSSRASSADPQVCGAYTLPTFPNRGCCKGSSRDRPLCEMWKMECVKCVKGGKLFSINQNTSGCVCVRAACGASATSTKTKTLIVGHIVCDC